MTPDEVNKFTWVEAKDNKPRKKKTRDDRPSTTQPAAETANET